MPTIRDETQLLRLLGNSPLQVNITLLKTNSYVSKNTSEDHLSSFYNVFDDIKDKGIWWDDYNGIAPRNITVWRCRLLEWTGKDNGIF